MSTTRISDVIVPEVFFPYMLKRTKERGAIFQSGILRSDANMASFLSGGGKTANVPFWRDLTDVDSDIGSDDPTELSVPGKLQSGKDVAARHVRTKSWSSMRLSGVLAGDDPMKAIGNLVSDWWIRNLNTLLVASLHGVYLDNAANDSGDMVNNISISTGSPTEAGPWAGMFEDLTTIAQQLSEGDLKKSGANAVIRQLPGAGLPGIKSAIHIGMKPKIHEALE